MERTAATLFGKTRRAVLAQLFLDPQREFRLRELARLTGISSGAVQYELRRLAAAALVRRTERNDLVTYRAGVDSPIFAELRAIVEKTSGIEALVREALQPASRAIRLAFIYGSIAKGLNRARSDLDLLVVGAIAFGELIRLLQPVEERIGREISPRLFSEREFRRRLKQRDRFLTSILHGPKIVLMGELHDTR
ncbi:MAG: MarR family transcriptional regulator [Betaproteobacteria bacterium]|nr:MAG: MarR family transcriptional regulator [Betaproteobacteria bacterium]